jgi:adenine-specific DNA-methyltransferase
MTYEQQFLEALKSIFIGAKVEGDSGYINLMKIKANYFEKGVFPVLMKDIDSACKPFEKGFREELFDKLYDFFQHYFSESGSIYFRNTAQHHNIYEKVYTDDRDVMLFWKTHMLYYVKTDRLFNSMEIEVDGEKFFFDVSGMELKRSNEKRELTYTFKSIKNGVISLTVGYSEKGRKTKIDEIVKAVKDKGMTLAEETLEKAFAVFQKQSEVDYFINKNAKAFLQEQFDLWMYQYVFKGESEFNETRLKQLQAIKGIAYKIIDFIAQFEDELVKVWNKPKFVLNSNYIITLDKFSLSLEGRGQGEGQALLKKIFKHKGMKDQIAEWIELGMVDKKFKLEWVLEKDVVGEPRYPQYQYLPLDTKYFKDLELDILALFDDLDSALDGWLIHSENYQALNTLLPKFRERVKCVHIDPPYNTDTSGFLYNNNYKHSSWLTMMENRISVGITMLSIDGSFLCHIDENEYERLQLLFENYSVPNVGTIIWDKKNPMLGRKGIATQHEYILWRSHQESQIYLRNDTIISMLQKAEEIIKKYGSVTDAAQKEYTKWLDGNSELSGGEKAYRYLDHQGLIYQSVSLGAPEPRTDPKFFIPLKHPVTKKPCPIPPNGFSRTPETLKALMEKDGIIFGQDESVQPRRKVYLAEDSQRQMSSVMQDASRGKMDVDKLGFEFPYCHPVSLYEKLNGAVTDTDDIVLDYFAGSGTTAHAVMNLNRADGGKRKYILVEMGEHFNTVILPRIKKVAFSDKWKDGKALTPSPSPKGRGEEGGKGISHFAKYFELEQYEDALKKARYEDAPLFQGTQDAYTSYVFLRDLKMLEAVRVDKEKNKVEVNLDKLYPNIDLAETLSCLTGKWIKRITKDSVEFQDGTSASLSAPEWEDVKPLIWW